MTTPLPAARAAPRGKHARTGAQARATGRHARPVALPAASAANAVARTRATRGRAVRRRPATTRAPAAPATRAPAARRFRQQAAARGYRAPAQTAHRDNYQPIILAEFVAAILLTSMTPFAKKNQAGLSPYAGQDMIKIAAITMTYLILALISIGGRGPGRIAAWFGGLILIGVGLGEAATIAKVLDIFGTPPAGSVAEGSAGGLPGAAEGNLGPLQGSTQHA